MAGLEAVPAKDGEKKSGPDKYEIENWTRTVIEAHEIMNDPEKMKYVNKEIAKKKSAMERVPVKNMAELKSRKADLDQMDDDEEMD